MGLENLKCIEKLCSCPWKLGDVRRFNALINSWQFHIPTQYQLWFYDEARRDFLYKENYRLEECQNRLFILGGYFGGGKISPLFPHTVELLDISNIQAKGKRGLAEIFPSLACITELKRLKLSHCVGIVCIETSEAQEQDPSMYFLFETVKRIDIYSLPDLKTMTNSRSYCFSELRVLKIERCPKIKVCLLLKLHQNHLHLEWLEVKHCNEMEEIFDSGDDTPGRTLALPNLSTLILWNLPNLKSIYSGELQCTCFWELDIRDCPKLETVPPLMPLGSENHGIISQELISASVTQVLE